MANYIFGAGTLTGGGANALDAIDGNDLNSNDMAVAITATGVFFYILNASCSVPEHSPSVIAPDSNPGTKRWILKGATGNAATTTSTTTSSTTTSSTTSTTTSTTTTTAAP